jgi:uncharacterized protein GlcG (DUF336 family)
MQEFIWHRNCTLANRLVATRIRGTQQARRNRKENPELHPGEWWREGERDKPADAFESREQKERLWNVSPDAQKGIGTMIQLADARRIIAAAEKKAEEIGQPMNVAVVDEGGNLIAFERMANAWLGSIDIAQKKAWTSRAFDITTKDLGANSQSGDQFFGIHASNNGRVMIFAGGIPLRKDGKIVGAIGISGGSGEQDHAVAEAGALAL